MKKHILVLLILTASFFTGLAQQNVGINTTTPDPSAALHVNASDKGVLIPRMNTEQRQLISNAATGLLVFDTDSSSFWFYNGSVWIDLSAPVELADADNDTKIQVEQTANVDRISFQVRGREALIIDSTTRIGIGTTNPVWDLDLRSYGIDSAAIFQLTNRDISQFLRLSSGKESAPGSYLNWSSGSDFHLATSTFDSLNFTKRMTVTGTGDIGIGTITPQERLEVAGKVKADTFLGDGSNLTGLLPVNPQAGDITYYDGSNWQRITKGLPGTVLKMGNNGVPEWVGTTSDLLEVTLTGGKILYVHPTDNSTGIEWGESAIDISGLGNLEYNAAIIDFNGKSNTQAITGQLENYNSGNYAAKLCADLVAFGFDDWYLPALGELYSIYQQLGPTYSGGSGDISGGSYWSSTENDAAEAWTQQFLQIGWSETIKTSTSYCRCVRK